MAAPPRLGRGLLNEKRSLACVRWELNPRPLAKDHLQKIKATRHPERSEGSALRSRRARFSAGSARLYFTPTVSKIGAMSVGTDFSRTKACFVSGRSVPIFSIHSFAPA